MLDMLIPTIKSTDEALTHSRGKWRLRMNKNTNGNVK
jgi:hypothetical protein